jgi:hypothetical protein
VRRYRFLLVVTAAFMAACADPFGPRFWSDAPDTTMVYSAARPELSGLPSAFDFIDLVRLRIEAPGSTGNWDVALGETSQGLVLIPAGAFQGIESRAAVALTAATTLAEVLEAPRDTAAYRREAVPLTEGAVYVIRTRRGICGFETGVRYAKIKAIEVDAAAGTLRFEYVRNPYCDDRSFVPPDR